MWKVTAGKLKSGINGLEHKMKSLVRRDDVTEPSDIGDFIPSKTPLSRNDQIVSLQHDVRPPSREVEGFRIVEDAPRRSSRRTQEKDYHESREYREPRKFTKERAEIDKKFQAPLQITIPLTPQFHVLG